VFRLNKEDLGRQGLCPLQGGHWFETWEGYAANYHPVTVCIWKEFMQQGCVSQVNLIMGCVVGKLTASGAASV
jgi:hypothetical protein